MSVQSYSWVTRTCIRCGDPGTRAGFMMGGTVIVVCPDHEAIASDPHLWACLLVSFEEAEAPVEVQEVMES